jgi:hypothetical protein
LPDPYVAALASDPNARVMVFIDGQNLCKNRKAIFGHPLCHLHVLFFEQPPGGGAGSSSPAWAAHRDHRHLSGEPLQGSRCGQLWGSFLMDLSNHSDWWSPAGQADAIMHESFHNSADFIEDKAKEREGNAACYTRFVETAAGLDDSHQRDDLCATP